MPDKKNGNYRQSERAEVPDEFKWRLDDLYPSAEAWQGAKACLAAEITKLGSFRGKLSKSSSALQSGLDLCWRLRKEAARLDMYANVLSDQDTRQSPPLAMVQEATQLQTALNSAASFVSPELLKIPKYKLDKFMSGEPKLSIYRQFLDDIMRRKAHTLDEAGERLIAEAGLMSDIQESLHRILSEADLPYPTIRLSDGGEARINPSNYVLYRESPNRADRKATMDAFFAALKSYERTFGVALYGEIKKNLFYRNARGHKTCIESALFKNNIPVGVYTSLIKNINESLPSMHRYLRLKREILGLEDLHYYDLYAPMVKGSCSSYTLEHAKKLILESTSILGKEYASVMEKAFAGRWIDIYPTAGKRSGAYMAGEAYDLHPYVLTNYNDTFDSVSTLAHELGHAAHSHFSNKCQPFVNSRYPIFLAEVASTVNEALLVDYVLDRVEDRAEKISLLGGCLEQFRTTLFRQTQFAEYELRIHEAAENGEALTGEGFSAAYLEILKKYYGHAKGVCTIDDPYGVEWAYIPHFYLNFYVFQYSTSFTASQAIAAKILKGDGKTIEKYLCFLKSGSSEYAIPTLKKVGIDMERPEPFRLALSRMEGIMDQIEGLQ
jgi:oligoendopeptidase F